MDPPSRRAGLRPIINLNLTVPDTVDQQSNDLLFLPKNRKTDDEDIMLVLALVWYLPYLPLLLVLLPSFVFAKDEFLCQHLQKHVFYTRLDHFNFRPTTPATFPLRYFVCEDHFRRNDNGPVFFYTGNEADILQFVNNSGFLFESSKEFGALVVFAEHRYYGESFPFGTADHSLTPHNIQWLTVEQAMADFNMLNVFLRTNSPWSPHLSDATSIIAFGGSYGANLALWLRLQHAHLWAGAIASSATPLKHLLRNTNGFARIETEAYGNVSTSCPDLVRLGWEALYQASRRNLVRALDLCPSALNEPDLSDLLHALIGDALETMVQYGYPYPTSFYNPVPAFPFRETCLRMLQAQTGLEALKTAMQVYYNWTGQAGPCFDVESMTISTKSVFSTRHSHLTASDPTGVAWSYQTCTEVYQPMLTDGVTDFEIPYTPNRTAYFENCRRRWDVEPRADWEEQTFGGADISAGSNIFLTNGQLDPWRAAGIQKQPPGSPSSIIIREIEQGAHHLDLRPSHPADPPSVKAVREEEKRAIQSWVIEWKKRHPIEDALVGNSIANDH